ncbi:MAG: MBL fold metallo-hydrolase [Phycisphaerae bacterium]|nr:MBL fold metallo-hydrolase [Phycisphaerae bacterium]
MSLPARFIFLGTGTSGGVPLIACRCATCTSADPRDTRSRTAAAIEWIDPRGTPRCVLIDAGPDLHAQALRHDLWRCDAILFTHNHVDHIFGLDEVRRFNAVMQAPIDLYAEGYVLDSLRRVYKHIFDKDANVNDSFVATLIAHEVPPPPDRGAAQAIELFGMRFMPIRLYHGRLPVLGWRIEKGPELRDQTPASDPFPLAYCTDVSSIPPETWPLLEGLHTLVLDALRIRKHPTHFALDQSIDAALRIGAGQTWFVHMSHEITHAAIDPELPEGLSLAHDGLTLGSLGESGERSLAEAKARMSAAMQRLDPGAIRAQA